MFKTFLRRAVSALALVSGATLAFPQFAHAEDPGVKVGVLTCTAKGGWGYVLGSSRSVDCAFEPTDAKAERYTGKLTKIGMDIGYKGKGVMVWTVVAPASTLEPGVLAGDYGGLTAGASVGVGLSANALVGGSDKHIGLQPLSVEGNTGLNIAGGIGGLSLAYAGS